MHGDGSWRHQNVNRFTNQHIVDMPSVEDVFTTEDPEAKLKEVRGWLAAKGVRDFEPVSLFCDQLDKVSVIQILSVDA